MNEEQRYIIAIIVGPLIVCGLFMLLLRIGRKKQEENEWPSVGKPRRKKY